MLTIYSTRFIPKFQFAHKIQSNNKIPFLDVLTIRNKDKGLSTTVYKKSTNTDIYIHWNTFAPETWKKGTLRTPTTHAYTVCSNEKLLQDVYHQSSIQRCKTKQH